MMKMLFISDVESPALWDYYRPERVEGVDVIISCGDLRREYLEFLVTMTGKPLLYVPGNHDTRYIKNPPEGCECIDDEVYTVGGVRFAGLGGCKYYNSTDYQYTEKQMEQRVRKLRRKIRKAGGLDVLVTHAAMSGYGDAEDIAHQGFRCFHELVEEYHPSYLVHGHIHRNYGADIPRTMQCASTTIVNAYERHVLVMEPVQANSQPAVRHGLLRRFAAR